MLSYFHFNHNIAFRCINLNRYSGTMHNSENIEPFSCAREFNWRSLNGMWLRRKKKCTAVNWILNLMNKSCVAMPFKLVFFPLSLGLVCARTVHCLHMFYHYRKRINKKKAHSPACNAISIRKDKEWNEHGEWTHKNKMIWQQFSRLLLINKQYGARIIMSSSGNELN